MTRAELVQKNRGVFGKIINSIKEFKEIDRKELLAQRASDANAKETFDISFIGVMAGAPVTLLAAGPTVAAVAAAAAIAYPLVNHYALDKVVVDVASKMTDKVKSIFNKQLDAIRENANIEPVEAQTSTPMQKQEENPLFDKMNKIVEAHNRGDKFDTQTGQPLGASPIDTMKQQGINDDQIKAWQNREIDSKMKLSNSVADFAAIGRESGATLKDAAEAVNRPAGQKLKV